MFLISLLVQSSLLTSKIVSNTHPGYILTRFSQFSNCLINYTRLLKRTCTEKLALHSEVDAFFNIEFTFIYQSHYDANRLSFYIKFSFPYRKRKPCLLTRLINIHLPQNINIININFCQVYVQIQHI